MKDFLKKNRLKVQHFWRKIFLKHHDFTIISNNCWGTRTYQKYGLSYSSPFQSLFIFAPDYLNLITNFSVDKLIIEKFISYEDSKYKTELEKENLDKESYPIGVLKDGTELHFLHYKTAEDAHNKWDRRVKRINVDKMIFKFSDGYASDDALIERFDALPYKYKICFTAKAYPHLKSIVYMDRFRQNGKVELEWKYDKKYINFYSFIKAL